MGAYSPRSDLLKPDILPDTQGLGPGITAVGNAFAGALQTYGQNKRADARRVEDRAWQQEDQIAQYGRQDARDDKVFGRQDQLLAQQKQEREMEKALKKQEEADAADGILAGQFALFGKYVTPETAAATQRMSPKAKMEFAQAFAGFGAQKHREEAEANQRAQPPTPWAVTVPGGEGRQIFGADKNVMGTMGGPSVPQLTPEQLAAYGLKPDSVTVGGVTYKAPKPQGQGSIVVPGTAPTTAPLPDAFQGWASKIKR